MTGATRIKKDLDHALAQHLNKERMDPSIELQPGYMVIGIGSDDAPMNTGMKGYVEAIDDITITIRWGTGKDHLVVYPKSDLGFMFAPVSYRTICQNNKAMSDQVVHLLNEKDFYEQTIRDLRGERAQLETQLDRTSDENLDLRELLGLALETVHDTKLRRRIRRYCPIKKGKK